MPRVLAVCVVHQLHDDASRIGTTAIDKRPVDGPVRVNTLGLRSDVQADRKDHGGEDKAVYAYAVEDAEWWEEQLGREVPPGWFGENLRVEGLEVSDAVIGTRWRIGTGDDAVELEATLPRTPCATFARWVGEEDRGWVKRFSDARRLGAYLRVVHTGTIRAGDEIEVVHVPDDAPTLLDIYAGP